MKRYTLLTIIGIGFSRGIASAGTYTLNGAAQYTAVPTIGEWGVIILTALFMISGVYFASKKETPASLAMFTAALMAFPFLV